MVDAVGMWAKTEAADSCLQFFMAEGGAPQVHRPHVHNLPSAQRPAPLKSLLARIDSQKANDVQRIRQRPVVLAVQLQPGYLQCSGHAHLLDLAALREFRFEVPVVEPEQWVNQAMSNTLTLDLAAVVGAPASPKPPGVQLSKRGQFGCHHGPGRGGIDAGLFDVGQRPAERLSLIHI